MEYKGFKLTEEVLEHALVGGTILGGGGGGSLQKGRKYGKIATSYGDLRLVDIDDIKDDEYLLTASLVGAPNAANQFLYPSDFSKTIEILQNNCDLKIGGIITNENGGEATINGWLQASILNIPLVDAPCNGRAHPTGVMGSMNLHKVEDYKSIQAVVGGNPDTGNRIQAYFEGTIEHTSRLVRLSSIEAGGLVAVARNPVSASYAKENCAIGGIKHAIELGQVFNEGMKESVENAVDKTCKFLNGKVLAKGIVDDFEIKYEGGFDVGHALVDGCSLTFWNEYATAEKNGERLASFPDLIMTIDAITGEPVTTAMMEKGKEVYVIATSKENLKLSKTMRDKELLKSIEDVIKKDIVSYL